MQVLFVHGMGRTRASGWFMLRRLRRAGFHTQSFAHWASRETVATIVSRLTRLVAQIASGADEYILIGHSLGGVLLRQALQALPPSVPLPRHLFLLGSPVQRSSIAARMGSNPLYRLLTGDCGRMLGSAERMAAVGAPAVPVTGVVGVKGWSPVSWLLPPGPNDGIVTLAEASAAWLTDVVKLPVTHTFLPSDARVAEVVLARLRG